MKEVLCSQPTIVWHHNT